MGIDTSRIKKQIISLLNANESEDGVRVYSTDSGDPAFIGAEIDTAIAYAKFAVMEAICSTESPLKGAFVSLANVEHGEQIPEHYGSIGVPVITPFENAPAALVKQGTRRSVEQIAAYRENPVVMNANKLYADIDHDQKVADAVPSPLAGFYSVVENALYFTGYSASVPLATIAENDGEKIPESKEPAVQAIALGKLAKDGTISEKFGEWAAEGQRELDVIRGTGGAAQPSAKPTVGTRDSGTK